MSVRVWALAALAAVAGATAGAHPAGWRPADVVLTGAFAGVVTLAGAKSQRWAWLVVAGVAVVVPSTPLPTACAVAAVALALVWTVRNRQSAVVGAIVAGLAVQSLLRMRGFSHFGVPSLVAFLAVMPLFISAYRSSSRQGRRVVRRSGYAFAALALLFLGAAGMAGLEARHDIQQAVGEAQAGLDAAQNGDRDTAMAQLAAAEASFGRVSDLVDAWWAQPVRAVPVVGQQMAAAQVMADEGHALARTASDGVARIDYDRLRLRSGAIDLDLLRSAQAPIDDAVAALAQASNHLGSVNRHWLVGPLRDRYDQLTREVNKTLPPARNASTVVALGPELLGGDTPKHYVVLLGTPSESRELGGLAGNYAEITADKGKLTLTRSGRSPDLSDRNGALGFALQPGPYRERFDPYQVTRFFQNVTASPDFPEVANVTEQIYPQATGVPVDGVFYMDPYALASLLQLTGPVELPDAGVTLDSGNAAKVLLVDQYIKSGETQERFDFLEEATRLTFNKLTTGDLPKPAQVASVMSPSVAQGRLLAYSQDPKIESLFHDLAMDGAFPAPQNGDFLEVAQSNAGANKIDAYLQKSITDQVSYRPDTGAVASTVTISLTNSAPASGLDGVVLDNIHGLPEGTNQLILTVYSPLSLVSASAAGVAAPTTTVDRFGVHAYSVEVAVPPGATQDVQLQLKGAIKPSLDYSLTLARQPTVNQNAIDVRVAGADGWKAPGQQGDAAGPGVAVGGDRVQVVTERLHH
jgi:hypothetical protein